MTRVFNPEIHCNPFLHRISVIFRVRSAKAIKITDLDLIKRLGIIVSIFVVFLSIRTIVGPPHVIVAKTADDLKAYICQTDWWDHVFTASKFFIIIIIFFFLNFQSINFVSIFLGQYEPRLIN